MPEGRHIVLACDESGAKGYADQDEAFPGEVGVFAGILIPQQEREAEARPRFQALCDRYRLLSGKLHIADLSPEQQTALRTDVFTAIREMNLPCFWYAIHVSGLQNWVHHARLLAVIGVRKTFPHGLGPNRKSSMREQMFSALPLKADVAQRGGHVRFVTTGDGSRLGPAMRRE